MLEMLEKIQEDLSELKEIRRGMREWFASIKSI